VVNVCRKIKDAANAQIGLLETSESSAAARKVALSNLNPPAAWDSFRGQSSEREFAIALSEPKEGAYYDTISEGGGRRYSRGPLCVCAKLFKGDLSRPYCLPSRELYKWVVPQLEYAAITRGDSAS
jgi:hypothetical protein